MNLPMPARFGNIKRPTPETPASRALVAAMKDLVAGGALNDIALKYGLPVDMLNVAWDQYHKGATNASSSVRIRSGMAARRKLTAEQEQDLKKRIRSFTPDQLGLSQRAWTKEGVRDLVLNQTGIKLPPRTLATYLERWGFAPVKPLHEFHRRNPQFARAWMKQGYPVIAMQARECKGLIHWWGIVPLPPYESSLALYDRIEAPLSTAHSAQMVFVVTNRGHLQWVVQHGAASSTQIIDFFDRLDLSTERRSFVLIHDRPLFSSPEFIDWSLRNKDRIEFHFLPGPQDAPLPWMRSHNGAGMEAS